MKTVSIFKNGNNRAIRIPKEFDFDGINELEIIRDGDSITLRPAKPNWLSFKQEEKADSDFLKERSEIIEDGRVKLW